VPTDEREEAIRVSSRVRLEWVVRGGIDDDATQRVDDCDARPWDDGMTVILVGSVRERARERERARGDDDRLG
jgi:hypothetical protein